MAEVRAPGRDVGLRCVRALGVSALAWAVTSPAHVLAGGSAPGMVGTAGLVLFTAWPLVALLGGMPSRVRMVLALLAAQGIMHCLMELLGGAMSGSSSDSVLLAGGHHGHTLAVGEAAGTLAPTPAVSHGMLAGLVPGPAMIAVHVVAALLLGLVLTHGEHVLRSVLGLLAAVLLPIAATARSLRAAVRAAAGSVPELGRVRPARVALARPGRHVLDVVARPVVRRGPPAPA